MSFDINWAQLTSDRELTDSIRVFLDRQFRNLSLPSYISDLSVTDFHLGTTAPEITIRHIGDPFEDFYQDPDDVVEGEVKNWDAIRKLGVAYSESESDDEEYGDDNITYNMSMSSDVTHSHDLANSEVKPTSVGVNNPSTDVANDGRRGRTPLESVSMILGNGNFNYLHNYNINNVGLGNLNMPASRTGAESPSTLLNHKPYTKLKEMSESGHQHLETITPTNSQDNEGDEPGKRRVRSKERSSVRHENDIQLIGEINYEGDMHLELKVNLLVNYPSPSFISLPIKLHVTDFAIHSIVALAYLKNSVFVSFLCDVSDTNQDYFTSLHTHSTVSDTSTTANGGNFVDYVTGPINRERIDIIKKVKIESEIGESEQNALRNVGKVEKFLVEQLRNTIRDEIAWPSWVCLDLAEDQPQDSELQIHASPTSSN